MRTLAAKLGLAPNTVAKAYRETRAPRRHRDPRPGRQFVSGDRVGRAAREAAQEYADRVTALGVAPAEAVNLVRRALEGRDVRARKFSRAVADLPSKGARGGPVMTMHSLMFLMIGLLVAIVVVGSLLAAVRILGARVVESDHPRHPDPR